MRLKTPKELAFDNLRKLLNEGKLKFEPCFKPSPTIIHMDMAKIEERVLAEAVKPIKVAVLIHDSGAGKRAVIEAALRTCDALMIVEDNPVMKIEALPPIPEIDFDMLRDKHTVIGVDLAKGRDFSAQVTYHKGKRKTSIQQVHKKNYGRRGQR